MPGCSRVFSSASESYWKVEIACRLSLMAYCTQFTRWTSSMNWLLSTKPRQTNWTPAVTNWSAASAISAFSIETHPVSDALCAAPCAMIRPHAGRFAGWMMNIYRWSGMSMRILFPASVTRWSKRLWCGRISQKRSASNILWCKLPSWLPLASLPLA